MTTGGSVIIFARNLLQFVVFKMFYLYSCSNFVFDRPQIYNLFQLDTSRQLTRLRSNEITLKLVCESSIILVVAKMYYHASNLSRAQYKILYIRSYYYTHFSFAPKSKREFILEPITTL